MSAVALIAGGGCQLETGPVEDSRPTQVSNNGVQPVRKTMRFAVAGMTCGTCANSATGALAGIPGVAEARVTYETKAAVLRASPEVSRGQIRAALERFGFEARFPEEAPPPAPLAEKEQAVLDIRTVSHGKAFRIQDHLASGKFTIFDYYADWCGPCRLLTPKLERLVRDNHDVALRKVDISDWDSAVARQATREFKLPGLPYVRVYGPDGQFRGAVAGNQVEKVKKLIVRRKN